MIFRLALSAMALVSAALGVDAPRPLLSAGHPVDWWFTFKLNSGVFPECGAGSTRVCIFGGTVQDYKLPFGQQFAFASSEDGTLKQGGGCAGNTASDPIGATFDQVYRGTFSYVIWNDQFYDDPKIKGCTKECGAPWAHSKGMVAWNSAGEGFVMQVSTPSWPASGNVKSPRKDGNTLGCVTVDDVEFSQHFFALKLTKEDLVKVLGAMANSGVVTDTKNPQIVKNGGPPDVQTLVKTLGVKSKSAIALHEELSTGVELISKPAALMVPPWQMVSSFLKGVSLRTATWWAPASETIPSTTAATKMGCWSNTLGKPGAVEIATSGRWADQDIGLEGSKGPNSNHAKIGVSTSGTDHLAIFGDMNQDGDISGTKCGSSQNGRGGLFFVVNNPDLWKSVGSLIKGDSAPLAQ